MLLRNGDGVVVALAGASSLHVRAASSRRTSTCCALCGHGARCATWSSMVWFTALGLPGIVVDIAAIPRASCTAL